LGLGVDGDEAVSFANWSSSSFPQILQCPGYPDKSYIFIGGFQFLYFVYYYCCNFIEVESFLYAVDGTYSESVNILKF